MKKPPVLFFLFLAVLGASVLIALGRVARDLFMPRPLLIIVSADTLRPDHLGCYGYPLATSPRVDHFSGDAVLFEDVVSQSPTTAPSHMTLFTGLMPKVHGILDSSIDIHRQKKLCSKIPLLAETLKKAGYLTAGFYEEGALWPELGFGRGFDVYGHGLIDRNLDDVRQWLGDVKKKNKPAFLFLHHYICHDPYLRTPQPVIDGFLREKAPGLLGGLQGAPDGESYASLRERFWKNADPNDPAHRKHVMALYDAAINYADALFGEFVDILKKEGLYERAAIVFLSDHGEEFGEHGGWAHGRLFDEHLQVPLIIKFPGRYGAGRKVAQPARLIDVMPTLLDLLGVKAASPMQGVSLMPLIREKQFIPCSSLASYSNDLCRIRIKKGLFVYSQQGGAQEASLFDRRSDPLETVDLAGALPECFREMRQEADAAMAADVSWRDGLGCGDEDVVEPDAGTVAALRSLGYIQ